MLITFHTDAYEDITYFADVAKRLLAFMGHSGTIPGAFRAEELPEALHNLQAGLLGNSQEDHERVEDDDSDAPISLQKRALPLINLLKAAIAKDKNVLWD